MKGVLMSIRPEWCELIASGKKTVEIRKTIPRKFVHDGFYGGYVVEPFKVYIYETQGYSATPQVFEDGTTIFRGRGKVIGEFVCDRIRPEPEVADGLVDICLGMQSCVDPVDILKYANGKMVYSWHISDLIFYDKPKELSEFTRLRETKFGYEPLEITKPPQSWCYVEEVTK